MVLGQSVATAASLAIESNSDVQQVDYAKLRERLLADQQILEWTGPKKVSGAAATSLPGVVVDDSQAEFIGEWTVGATIPGYVGQGYRHDHDLNKGRLRAVFTLPIKTAGKYEVRVSYPVQSNRATNVPVTVAAADGEHRYTVNQKKAPEIDGLFHKLDVLSFDATTPATVTIETTGTDGHVVVDAVQLIPAK